MKVVKNFLWNAGYQLFVLLIPLVTIPYVNRILGPVGIGINSYTNSIVQYFILFGSLGVNIYGNREIAYNRGSVEKMSRVFWEITILRSFTVGIACILYLIFIMCASPQFRFYYVLQGILLFGAAFDISWLFQGLENFRITVLRNAFVKIAGLVFIFLFVRGSGDTWVYILVLSGSQFLGYLTLWPQLRKIIRPVRLRELNLVKHLRPSVTLLVPQIATQVYLQLNKTMLGALDGVSSSGFYDNSDKIVKMLLAIVTATGTVLLPHVAHRFAEGDHAAVRHSLEVSMHVILLLAFPMAFGLAAISQPFTVLFFSSKFATVAPLMAVESIVIVLIGISNAVGTQYLLPTNQLGPFSTSVILGSIVNVILNIPLILLWGAMGAVIATVFSELSVSAYQLFRVRKQLTIAYLFTECWKYVLASGIMYACIWLAVHYFAIRVWAVVIEVLLGIVVYVGVLLLLRPSVVLGYAENFMKKKQHGTSQQ